MDALERQLQELRTQFSAELERTRELVAVAQERASATERRARCAAGDWSRLVPM
ncbi:hypothetical protein RR42_m2097 [Cupriavidus basilensis]|uniref:Uncharacterized protein n=1 Tax=Cupriavidus basilensis TaxID=68895 RepID=A0A0C4YB83_9BURK|nr:hypothetical protein RR42_m2097 [Cupriavidus basilensis]